jgi:hypothetical protein
MVYDSGPTVPQTGPLMLTWKCCLLWCLPQIELHVWGTEPRNDRVLGSHQSHQGAPSLPGDEQCHQTCRILQDVMSLPALDWAKTSRSSNKYNGCHRGSHLRTVTDRLDRYTNLGPAPFPSWRGSRWDTDLSLCFPHKDVAVEAYTQHLC